MKEINKEELATQLGGVGRPLFVTVARMLGRLKRQLDEADRRAGAAERLLDYEKSKTAAREDWLRKAKEQWGVSTYISFDHVWEKALALKKAADANSKHNPQE